MDERKRIEPILIKDKETEEVLYTLDFTRNTVSMAERRGFVLDDVTKFPLTGCRDLFYWALQAHHRNLRRDQADELFDSLGGIEAEGLMKRLYELYNQAILSGNEKNSKLTLQL